VKLLIDVGNSYCKYVTYQNGTFSTVNIVQTCQVNQQWLEKNFSGIEQCLVSNVSHDSFNEIISFWCKSNGISHCFIESEAQRFNVQCAYNDPSTFGVDRWLGLLGADKLFPKQASLIVDSGTATTIDLLASTGKHQGGWILPGIDLMFSSVINNTDKVFATPEKIEKIRFSNNTSDAVNKANWAATLGCITTAMHTAHKYYLQPNESLNVILTGGNAQHLSQLIDVEFHLIDNLVFIGMNRYNAIKTT
jgi:type III pantothenate kinase